VGRYLGNIGGVVADLDVRRGALASFVGGIPAVAESQQLIEPGRQDLDWKRAVILSSGTGN